MRLTVENGRLRYGYGWNINSDTLIMSLNLISLIYVLKSRLKVTNILLDGSGYITEEELFIVMTRFRGAVTKEEINKMVQKIDKDNDKRINKKGEGFYKYILSVIKRLNSFLFYLKKEFLSFLSL